ncbi:MAG: formyltransferase family protein [Candidatus Nanohalobium sp.]
MSIRAIFLGTNPAGEKVYDWLNQQEDVEVLALLTEKSQLSLIRDLEPEIVIASGFEHKVPEEIIDVPEKGVVNLHPSFLPYNRGAHPYIWPIVEDTPAGVSIHYMSEEIDEGPIIDRREVEVRPDDTAETLYDRLQEEQFHQFKDNWGKIKEGVEGREQNLERGTVHYRDDLDELCELDLEEKGTFGEFLDRLRALQFSDHETAYFERNGEKYFLDVEVGKSSS